MSQAVRLSKSAIEQLKAPSTGRLYVRDTERRGLLLQVTPGDIRSFQLYRKVAGRPTRITLGTFDPAIAEARELPSDVKTGDEAASFVATRPSLNVRMARRLIDLLPSAGTKPADLKRASLAGKTVKELFEDYNKLHLAVNCKAGAVERQSWANDRVVKQFGSSKVLDLAGDEVARWYTEMRAVDGLYSANRALEHLSAGIGWGRRTGQLPKSYINPAMDIDKGDEVSRERFVMAHEAPVFFAELDALDEHWRDLFKMLVLTGARRSAVQSMQWQHVELAAGIWHMPSEDAKNCQPTAVVLVPQAVEILKRREEDRPAGTAFVFPSASESGHIVSPKNAWKNLIDRVHRGMLLKALAHAKVKTKTGADLEELEALAAKHKIACERPDLRPHDLRRTLGSWMAKGNTSLQIVGKALGHKSVESTKIYSRLQLEPVMDAQSAAVDALFAAANVTTIDKARAKRATRAKAA